MKTLTIRGIDTELDFKIKERAKQNGESINKIVLRLINSAFGLEKNKLFPTYHVLDSLAGTWTKEDENNFNQNIKELSEVDKNLWK